MMYVCGGAREKFTENQNKFASTVDFFQAGDQKNMNKSRKSHESTFVIFETTFSLPSDLSWSGNKQTRHETLTLKLGWQLL